MLAPELPKAEKAKRRKARRKERRRALRQLQVPDDMSTRGVIAMIDKDLAERPNTFRTSPPRLLEQLHIGCLITDEQLSAGQWYRGLFEEFSTHYPAVTASYNPAGSGGHDHDDTDELSPVHREIGILANVLTGLCVFDGEYPLELTRQALNRAASVRKNRAD